jgi:hypothetical protein
MKVGKIYNSLDFDIVIMCIACEIENDPGSAEFIVLESYDLWCVGDFCIFDKCSVEEYIGELILINK